jgi:hypothetical protein
MDENETPISWKGIGAGARLVTADGQEIGRVEEVAGDPQADIFDGLVVSLAGHHAGHRDKRYVAAERVGRIWPDRVEVDLGADEAARLPAYTEPKSVTWSASESGRITARLRSAFKDLFGRRG